MSSASNNHPKRKNRRAHSAFGAAFFALLLLVGVIGSYGYLFRLGADVITEGVNIGRTDIGGLTPKEAVKEVAKSLEGLKLTFKLDNQVLTLDPDAAGPDGKPLTSFDLEGAAQDAMKIGRRGNFGLSAAERFNSLLSGRTVPLKFTLDKERLLKVLTAEFGAAVTRAENAHLAVRLTADGTPAVTVLQEREGLTIDYPAAIDEAEARLSMLSLVPVPLKVSREHPSINARDAQSVSDQVPDLMNRAPVTVTISDRTWTINRTTIADWLDVLPGDGADTVRIGLDQEKSGKYLENKAKPVRIEPTDAVFTMKDGKVVDFAPGVEGLGIDTAKAVAFLESYLRTGKGPDGLTVEQPLELPTAAIAPAIPTEAANPYGIKEVIGIGESNFVGSPKNRRLNIANGAKGLNGVLVMPGEEFSTMKALGPIDNEHGYLEELVIKDNKTTPEFGGGLCQIGTTTFRTVLASGLPVTERRNHSYRVSYYERDGAGKHIGPGKDATIYDPAPDFKFKNDTAAAILIRTAIKGNRITFTFWGAKDGRKTEQTDVRVWNIKPPPPKKTIETPDLPPGQERCTEKPHEGADATFTYTVTYADGRVEKKEFFSRYRPWGEVCLVGVDPNAPKSGGEQLPSADAEGVTGN